MSSNVVKIAIGAALALLLVVLLVNSGEDPKPIGPKLPQVDPKAADAVRQRLDQLRSSRGQEDEEAPAGQMKVEANAPAAPPAPPAVAATPGRAAPPAAPAAARPMQRPPDQVPPAPQGGNVTGSSSVRDTMDDIPTLRTMAITDKDPDKRLEAITLLGATEEPDVVPVLGQALSDEDAEVRLAAIQALADFTGDDAFDLLGKVVTDDPDADNRYEALEALNDTDDERAAIFAKKALENETNEDVRELAETILGMDSDGGAAAAPMHR